MTQKRDDGDDTGRESAIGDVPDISRREFIRLTGVMIAGAGAGVGFVSCGDSASKSTLSLIALPVSTGYLVVDTAKCQGCVTCMLACSLVHDGVTSLSASRIQIVQNSFDSWPSDIFISHCRQCQNPECVKACPRRALDVDTAHGNVRRVDRSKCIGCGKCVKACPYLPKRPVLAPDPQYKNRLTSRKCDLCLDTPHLRNSLGEPVVGGPGGMQACVQVCPVGAIKFTAIMPEQTGNNGYYVNLKEDAWATLGFPLDTTENPDAGAGQG
jgi:protein NrfC